MPSPPTISGRMQRAIRRGRSALASLAARSQTQTSFQVSSTSVASLAPHFQSNVIAGTIIADATNAQEVGAINTVINGITASITASGECSLATATESGGGASAACSFSRSGQLVDSFSGTATTTVVTSAYTSLQTLLAVQIPDTGSGAIPTAVATSSSGSASGTNSAPTSTSTKNAAFKERFGWGVAVGAVGVVVAGLV